VTVKGGVRSRFVVGVPACRRPGRV
jgi:hypothetical protein